MATCNSQVLDLTATDPYQAYTLLTYYSGKASKDHDIDVLILRSYHCGYSQL